MDADEQQGVMDALFESHVQQMAPKVVMPVARRATQSIEGLAEFPVCAWGRDGTSRRRSYDNHFVVGQHRLAKRILAVALF
jgi:hypothetical protein